MVGTAQQVERATPVLMAMGNELINAGGPGMGIRVKLINNYMSIALNALSAEAAVLCEALGLSFDVALKVMSGTPAGKGHFTTSWPNKVLKGDLSPAFMIDLAHKDLGIALDGDGDRVIMVDHEGNKVDGDQIMYIIAREALRQGQLRGGAVGTLMSNMGLEVALKQLGIPFTRAKVGDRYVLEKMQEKGWRIGAENSGHVILLDKTTTGDGIVAGLQVVAAMVRNHMTLHDLCSGMKMFPQVLVNIRYTDGKSNPLENEAVKAVTAEVEAALGNRGRVLLRKSGTEPLIRVMVEGEDEAQVTEFAHRIADAVKAA